LVAKHGKVWRLTTAQDFAAGELTLKYLIFYRLIPGGIELIRVYHAARDIDAVDSSPNQPG
jgi:hypothetical protein